MEIRRLENKYDCIVVGDEKLPIVSCDESGCHEYAEWEIDLGMFRIKLCHKCVKEFNKKLNTLVLSELKEFLL